MPLSAERSMALRVGGVLLLALASFWVPKLALPACLVVLLVALSLPRLRSRTARLWARTGIVFSGFLAAGAFAGFVLHEAIPGVIAGGNQDAEKRAIGFLRNLVVAEDHARVHAWLDVDHDGIGSAATLKELCGLAPLRDGAKVDAFPLYLKPEQLLEAEGETLVVQGAYLYKLCLPSHDGSLVPSSHFAEVDLEKAERAYSVYAWPRSFAPGHPRDAYFVDAEERILINNNSQDVRYQGEHGGPPCDAMAQHPQSWHAWKGKTARPSLPGDSAGKPRAATDAKPL